MKKKNQPKGTALDRRRFLLKSTGVAGVLSAPTLSHADWWSVFMPPSNPVQDIEDVFTDIGDGLGDVLNPIGNEVPPITDGILPPITPPSLDGYPDEIRYIGNPTHKNKVWKQDNPALHELTTAAGIPDWEYCEVVWQNSDDALMKFGSLTFYSIAGHVFRIFPIFPFPGLTGGGRGNIIYNELKFKFRLHQVYDGNGDKDLDASKGLEISQVGILGETPLNDTAPHVGHDELRRQLQYDDDWGDNWQIPDSWSSEFRVWATATHRASGLPAFGVHVLQWGARDYGLAMRQMDVYEYEYRFLHGNWQRRAYFRRAMFLFGGYVGGEWVNLAIDRLLPQYEAHLDLIGQGLYQIERQADLFRGGERPGNLLLPFNLMGWHHDQAGQREELRAALGAAVAVLVAGLDWVVPYQNAIRYAAWALQGLAVRENAPRVVGNVPLGGGGGDYYRWLGGLGPGATPVFIEGVQANFGHNWRHFQQGPRFNFAVNNYWIDNAPVFDANGRGNWEIPPAALLQNPQILNPPPPDNLQANNTFPIVQPFRRRPFVPVLAPIPEEQLVNDFVGDMLATPRAGTFNFMSKLGILD